MDKRLLSILCCPVTHKLVNRNGVALSGTLKEALVTDDGKRLYPVKDGIPVLLEGESVGLEQLDAG
jgi:uncharacterized protein YbaR (Trm112 family)